MNCIPERRKHENQESQALDGGSMRIAQSNRGVSEPVNLPADRVDAGRGPEPSGQRLQRVEHGAGEKENEIKDGGNAVEDVIPACLEQRWNRRRTILPFQWPFRQRPMGPGPTACGCRTAAALKQW